jgi:hypothetical protein
MVIVGSSIALVALPAIGANPSFAPGICGPG